MSGAFSERPQPVERGDERRLVVGAHHAAAAGQRDRLDDARKRRRGSSDRGSVAERSIDAKPGHGQAGGAQPLARQLLVARDRGRRERVPRQVRAPRTTRAAITVGRSPTASTPSIGCSTAALERSPRSTRASSWNRIGSAAVLPRILEHVAAIGGEHQIDAEPFGRLAKRAGLVAGRRREQQHSTHQHPALSALAQHSAPSTLQTVVVRPELPAPDSARRNSTRARSDTARPRGRAPRRRAGRGHAGALVREVADRVEHLRDGRP